MRALVATLLAAMAVAMCIGYGARTRPILADDQLYFFMAERCASAAWPAPTPSRPNCSRG